MTVKLDTYDKKILYELDINSRLSVALLAKKIKLSKETVKYRIRRLLERKYVKNFYAIINASPLGYQYYRIALKFQKLTAEVEKRIVEYIQKEKSCANLRILEGHYDMDFLAIHRTSGDLKRFLEAFSKQFGSYLQEKAIHKIITSCKLNQKVLWPGPTVKKSFYHGEPSDEVLSPIDYKLILALSRNARLKLIELARITGVDPRVLSYHIKKLEQKKIIVGYSTSLNFELFHLEFIQIDISLKHHGLIPRIISFFDQTYACLFAYELIGLYDLSVEIYVESDEQLRKILALFKETFLEHYISYNVSRIYDEQLSNWSPFEG